MVSYQCRVKATTKGASNMIRATLKGASMEDQSIEVGTISHGTLRPQDLMPVFLRTLEQIAPLTYSVRVEGTYAEEYQHAINGTLEQYLETATDERGPSGYKVDTLEDRAQYVSWALEALEDDLSANAPEGMYFGTLEGDGSDFGFWPQDCYS
jgi:hypothetical protein